MTDNELKELVASLAVSQIKTDDELKALVAGLAVSDAALTAKFDKRDSLMAKTDAKIDRTDAHLKEASDIIKRVSKTVGNISNNNGSIAEEYFYNSLKAKPILGKIKYDRVDRNIKGNIPSIVDEFDIVMYNGDSIALIECKSKAHTNDLKKLIDQKADNFRKLFPYYKDYKIYLGLASFSFYDELKAMAKEKGIAILKNKGDVPEIEADNLIAY